MLILSINRAILININKIINEKKIINKLDNKYKLCKIDDYY